MRFLFTLIFLLSFHFVSCQATDKEVPDAVQKAFSAKYPKEKSPSWEIDAHGNFEAQFKAKGEKYRADFLPNGSWIETENSIKFKELPKVIRDKIDSDYSMSVIAEIEHVQHHSKGEFYDVEFKRKGKNKDVEFDPKGNVIN